MNADLLPKLIILDRDGVINKDLPKGCTCVEDFVLLSGVIEALRLINQCSIPTAIATNQALVGRGHLSHEGLKAIHAHMNTLFEKAGVHIGRVYVCTDTTVVPHFRRKPAPGMLLEAMRDYEVFPSNTVFIGDALRDLQAASAAKCQGILVKTGKGIETLASLPPDFKDVPIYNNLYDATVGLVKG